VDVWSFSGSAGQQLFCNAQAGSATVLHWALADPQRHILFSGDFRDRDTLTLPSTGTYYLTVDGRNGATGAYQFQVWNVPASVPVALALNQPVSGTIAVPGEQDRYTFSSTAGQAVFLDVLASGGGQLRFTLQGPAGTTLLTASNQNQNNRLTLPAGGTYTVVVGHGDTLAATGAYQFQLDLVPADVPQAITLNAPVSGSLTVPGQTRSYTFRGNLGERLALHVSANAGNALRFTLRDPSGNVLFANQAGDTTVASLPASGTCTLTAAGNGDAVGAYAFQLEDRTATVTIPAATPLPPSGITTTSLSGNPVGPFDFAHLQDITPLGQLTYFGTTFNRHTHTLYAAVQLTDVAPVALGHTVLLVFDRFTPPAVRPAVADGFHPDGRPFVAFTSELGPTGLQPGATSAALPLSFADPTGDRFGFDGTLLAPGNVAPMFTSTPPPQATSDTAYQYVPTVSDANGDSVTFRLTVAPAGLTVDPQTGVLSWTPTASQVGANNVTLVADDGRGGVATQSFVVQVLPGPANHNPYLVTTPATTTVLPAQTFTYAAQALDPDGDPLSWSLVTAPAGASLDAGTGLFTWTPAAADLGPHTVT
jgi:hypothetical protein